jgi:hypothetical protein
MSYDVNIDRHRGAVGCCNLADDQFPNAEYASTDLKCRRFKPVQDNAVYWSIATTMGSNDDAITDAEDALGLGTPK